MTSSQLSPTLRHPSTAVVVWEIIIVLGLSLGRAGIYAIVDLLEKMAQAPLSDQVTTLNPPLSNQLVFDLIRQLLSIGFSLIPVVLALHLIWIYGRNPFRSFGLDFRRPTQDLVRGLILFAAMGAGTLVVYAVGRAAGLTTALVASGLDDHWWTVPVLIASAIRHSLLEEVIVVAWLFDRLGYLQDIRYSRQNSPFIPTTPSGAWLPTGTGAVLTVLVISGLIRASYHLYQGIGPGVGNLLMGLVFGVFYLRYRRVMPLVYAHALIDIVGFVGYPWLAAAGWFGN